MKKNNILIIICLLISTINYSQIPPQAFNYSAVARDASSQPIANSTIGIQISIVKTSTTGSIQYVENHFVNTDNFGLFNLIIGAGAIQNGSMSSILWSDDNYYLKVAMDATGGTNFLTMGTTQLLSVPYALHAKTAESLTNGQTQSFSAPVLLTASATNILQSTATLNGSVNANGLLTDNITFEYGPTTSYGNSVNANLNYVSGTTQSQVQASLTNLNSNTLYHYRIKAKNAIDFSVGDDMTFTTTSGSPIMNPNGIFLDSINSNTYRFYTNLNPNGEITTVTFEYGSSISLGNTISCTPTTINGGSDIQIFSNNIVVPYTGTNMIFVRCKAVNSNGTVYSPIDVVNW